LIEKRDMLGAMVVGCARVEGLSGEDVGVEGEVVVWN
jgi:hypothetical protein